ncbi:MAG: guanine deaminase [Granulosicoccus sp.]
MAHPSLVIHGTAFHTPDNGALEVLENCAIAIDEKGTIEAVVFPDDDNHAALINAAKQRQVLHQLASDEYLIPGLIDLHIHAPQWPQLGKALDAPLEVWLQEYTFPLEARYSDHQFAYEIYDDLVQSLLAHGTTTAVYFGTKDLEANIVLAQSCLRHGQRALVGKVAMDDPEQCPDYYRDDSAAAALNDTRRFIHELKAMQSQDNMLVLPAITPRFIPSCTDELLYGLGKLAAETGCHIQTHCSESDWEVGFVRDRLNKTDTEALADYGLLTDKTILAHSIFVTTADLELMAQRRSSVAHCPLSNAYFANAVFPLRKAQACGVTVGLGTDISGGFSPSLFDATRSALMASRLACNGTAPELDPDNRGNAEVPLTTLETFHMATCQGGKALSLPIGQFKPGYSLDALCVKSNLPNSGFKVRKPEDDLSDVFEKLVLTASKSCITEVWVNGHDSASRCAVV